MTTARILLAALLVAGAVGSWLLLGPLLRASMTRPSPTQPEEPDERDDSGADPQFAVQLKTINEELKTGAGVIDEEPAPSKDMVQLNADFDAWQWELDQWAAGLAVEVANWATASAGVYRECAALLGEMTTDFIAQSKGLTVDLSDVVPASSLDAAMASFTVIPPPLDDFGLVHALVDETGEFAVVMA